MMAQATGAWLISLGVAAGHALLERDARRLRPAAAGYIVLAVLLSIALARYPHQFEWRSASGHRLPDLPCHDAADRRGGPGQGAAARGPPIRPPTGYRREDQERGRMIAASPAPLRAAIRGRATRGRSRGGHGQAARRPPAGPARRQRPAGSEPCRREPDPVRHRRTARPTVTVRHAPVRDCRGMVPGRLGQRSISWAARTAARSPVRPGSMQPLVRLIQCSGRGRSHRHPPASHGYPPLVTPILNPCPRLAGPAPAG